MSNILRIKDLILIDLSLYLVKHKTLVMSDFHIGLEEELNQDGVFVPRYQFKATLKRLDSIFEAIGKLKLPLERVVINGDLKHEFGRISNQEWKDTIQLIDYLNSKSREVVLIKGNHDTILKPIAEKKNLIILNELILGDTLITHGNKITSSAKSRKIKQIIIGHEHPAISITDGIRKELFKTFLIGRWKGKRLIVLPSFCLSRVGSNIENEVLSPFLKESNLKDFDVVIVGKGLHYFGRLADIERLKE